ncbi:MAG: SMC family ATPase, partial [Clostridia bacterium]|nr:SMC family ATPase [Clostridia bacterium]
VELTFLSRDKVYKVTRNPEYERKKSRGEGYTQEKANAVLITPEKTIAKVKDVNRAVEELLGIEREQFCQIAMIAQGDFTRLLVSTTEERKKIFQKIFGTQRYQRLQDELKSLAGEMRDKYAAADGAIRQYTEGIVCAEDSPFFDDVLKAKRGETPAAEIISLLEDMIAADIEAEEVLDKRLKECENQLDALNAKLALIVGREEVVGQIEKCKLALQDKEEQRKALAAELEAHGADGDKINALLAEAEGIKLQLSTYGELDEKRTLLKSSQAQISALEERLKSAAVQAVNLKERIASLSEESEGLKAARVEAAKSEVNVQTLKARSDEIRGLLADIEVLYAEYAEYNSAVKVYEQLSGEYAKISAEYLALNKSYLDAQAGIMAEGLKEGEPCPVCGATHHPTLAKKPAEAPDYATLEKYKKDSEKTGELASQASLNASNKKVAYETRKQGVKKLAAKYTAVEGLNLGDIKNALNGTYMGVNCHLKAEKAALEALNVRLNGQNRIEEELKDTKNKLETLVGDTSKWQAELSALHAKTAQYTKDIEVLGVKCTYPDKQTAEREIAVRQQQIKSISEQFESAKKNYNDCDKSVAETTVALKSLKQRLDGMQVGDAEAIKADLQKFGEEKQNISSGARGVHYRLEANRRCHSDIKKSSAAATEIIERYKVLKSLSDTANGTVSGKEKIMLETFVQGACFDRVLIRANRRFLMMSEGQYELRRRKSSENFRSQSGLELDVIDHYNGTSRSVKTLSGGETFMAALSLALGLSEEIQSTAGGIKLDAMFVDEGFGSLDEETLSKAIKALTSITNGDRLVGIISHVAELKEVIERQIRVVKCRTGGSKVTVI